MNLTQNYLNTSRKKTLYSTISSLNNSTFKFIVIVIILEYINALNYSFESRIGQFRIVSRDIFVPEGFRILTPQQNNMIKDQLKKQIDKQLITKAFDFSEGSALLAYKILTEIDHDGNFPKYMALFKPKQIWQKIANSKEYVQKLNKQKCILLPIGIAQIVPMNLQAPKGYRKMDIKQVEQYKQQINTILTNDSIVAFKNGKIDGKTYGNKISKTYGSECGQMLIVSDQTL